MIKDWSVPPEWAGERCFIIGGGPSFDPRVIPKLKGRIIAVNAAGFYAEHADVMFWADQRFLRWNVNDMKYFLGKYLIARHPPFEIGTKGLDIKRLRREPEFGLSTNPRLLRGLCSGSAAINLAFLFGATEIVLLGFDMQPVAGADNFHAMHKVKTASRNYDNFMAHFPPMAKSLADRGIAVHNTSRGSRLTCFPKTNIEEFL